MKTAIATVSISGDFREKLSAVASTGFNAIEIFENDFLAFDLPPNEVGQMVIDHGLEICLFQPFRDFEGLPEPYRQQAFDRAERKFDLMNQLGTDLVLICSNVSPHSLGGIDRAADDFAELGERAANKNIRVGYEALAWGRHVSDHRDAWEVVRRADHPNIGLILDSFHTLSRNLDVDTIRSIPGDKIFFVQLADAPLIDMDLLYWSRHFRNMPGEGDLDVVSFMRAISATGYDGFLSLEIFNDQFRGGSPKTIASDGYRSLVYLMDQVRRIEPSISIKVPSMPPRIEADGFEFVEFAANELEAETLSDIFKSLGFKKVGKHISKEVHVWRQGNINLVINTEREGFAHSFYLMNGTSVCDLGIKVKDADKTVQRAKKLGIESFYQKVGPGELEIPAIRGVGGGLLHFIDYSSDLSSVWDSEFKPIDDKPSEGTGLLAIDHIAQTMNYEEMLTWLLFYSSLFETTKNPMFDVIDPKGLVRSQAIESNNGSLRITLNGAENRKTLAGRFLAESFNSAVQHIAFNCDNIFKTSENLALNKFDPLAISANYYDDLQARFGIENELLHRLKSNNILYDQDNEGEYFQIYSKNYGEGFFFEIVERRGNYTGYGASNAQFRVAAQQRQISSKQFNYL